LFEDQNPPLTPTEVGSTPERARRRWLNYTTFFVIIGGLITGFAIWLIVTPFDQATPTITLPNAQANASIMITTQSCEVTVPGGTACNELPLEAAPVQLLDAQDGSVLQTGISDSSGTVSFTVVPGNYQVNPSSISGRGDLKPPAAMTIQMTPNGQNQITFEYTHQHALNERNGCYLFVLNIWPLKRQIKCV
jgi:hypothetical protein